MGRTILFLIVASLILTTIIINIICIITCKKDKKENIQDVKIIKRRKEVDNTNENKFFVTFEFINGHLMELLVPEQMYELAKEKITGRLTFESLRFIQFVTAGQEILNNLYSKEYKVKRA